MVNNREVGHAPDYTSAMKRDLLISFAVAFVLECYFALLFVFAPSKFLAFFHMIPVLLLELINAGRFRAGAPFFDLLVPLVQVLVLAALAWSVLRVWRKCNPKRQRLVTATICVVLLVLVVAALRPRLSRSSIQILADEDCACGDYQGEVTGLIVLNPLRSRVPEIAADEFLSDMRSGKCSGKFAQELCDSRDDPGFRAMQWKLKNRKDAGDTVSLFYVVQRPRDNAWGEAMVQVERTENQWKVTNYGAYY